MLNFTSGFASIDSLPWSSARAPWSIIARIYLKQCMFLTLVSDLASRLIPSWAFMISNCFLFKMYSSFVTPSLVRGEQILTTNMCREVELSLICLRSHRAGAAAFRTRAPD